VQSIKKKGFFNGTDIGTSEYEQRFVRARQKFMEKFSSPNASQFKEEDSLQQPKQEPMDVSSTSATPSLDSIEQAEHYKNQGNQMLSSKQYTKAIEFYTKAIELNPNNAIYYCNRAAAYSHMGQHQKAVDDCKSSINLNPNYSKAYGRLGLAYFSLGKYTEAVAEYKKGLQLEPNSSSLKESLAAAERKLNIPSQTSQAPTGATPNLANMFNNPDLVNQMGGMFRDPGGLQGILNNPLFQNMAQQMMNNPEMMNMATNLMQNPEALNSMLGNLGGGAPEHSDQNSQEKGEDM